MAKHFAALVALATDVVSAQVVMPEQTLDRRAIGERGAGVEFSPDGSRVVFSVADPVKGTTRARALWLYDLASGQSRQLTFSGKTDSSPQWSPDGTAIAFLSDRDGVMNVWSYEARTRRLTQATKFRDFDVKAVDVLLNESAVTSYAWTVDTMPPPPPVINGPLNPSNSTSATFSFTDADPAVSFHCNLDGHGFPGCSNPVTFDNLAA